MKKTGLLIITVIFCISCTNNKEMKKDIEYKDASLSIEERVEDLLSRMTLDEKLAQIVGVWNESDAFLDEDKRLNLDSLQKYYPNGLGQIARSFAGYSATEMAQITNEIQNYFVDKTRLGIPVLFHEECLHGVMENNAISFPHPIAMAGSFNTEQVEKVYSYIAEDARCRGARLALTPVLDVARDPRWGRVEETYGEDPYLIAQMATSAVRGFQGYNDSSYLASNKVMATLKHFAAHGQPEGGNNCAPANYSERVLREVFLFPFEFTIKNAKPKAIMASYNEIDGVPSHTSTWLLKKILRDEYLFDGFVVSDYYGIEQLEERHHTVATIQEAAKQALMAGVDIELPEPNAYILLKELIENGELDEAYLNNAVRRLLHYKFYAGLFDSPYVVVEDAKAISESKEAVKLSYEIASESAILLKNDDILPLTSQNKTIAVIGPNAKYHAIGGYSCPNENFKTIYQGIEEKFGTKNRVLYSKGCGITTDDGSWFEDEVKRTSEKEDRLLLQEAITVAKQSDVVILCIGGNEQTSREAWQENHLGDRTDLQMVGLQNELFESLYALKKPIIVVLNHGRPLAITEIDKKANAIIDCWYLGQESGRVVADIIDGTINPSGKLAISIPRSVGHIPSYYNYKPTARRGYLFDDVTPLYDFGYGLSYSEFDITNVQAKATNNETIEVSLDITNMGDYDGAEVVQLYVNDVVCSVTRPVKELKAFKKVTLKKGESQRVQFSLSKHDLSFYDQNMNFNFEPGEFKLLVGTSSNSKDLTEILVTLN